MSGRAIGAKVVIYSLQDDGTVVETVVFDSQSAMVEYSVQMHLNTDWLDGPYGPPVLTHKGRSLSLKAETL
jgi:hypothetical protein